VFSIYRNAFINFRFGYAAAQAMLLFVMMLMLTAVQFLVFEHRVTYQ